MESSSCRICRQWLRKQLTFHNFCQELRRNDLGSKKGIRDIPLRKASSKRTGLLLRQGHIVPINLHAVSELHPELCLLLRRHGLPSLLDTSNLRVGNGMFGRCASELLLRELTGVEGSAGRVADGARHRARGGAEEHYELSRKRRREPRSGIGRLERNSVVGEGSGPGVNSLSTHWEQDVGGVRLFDATLNPR